MVMSRTWKIAKRAATWKTAKRKTKTFWKQRHWEWSLRSLVWKPKRLETLFGKPNRKLKGVPRTRPLLASSHSFQTREARRRWQAPQRSMRSHLLELIAPWSKSSLLGHFSQKRRKSRKSRRKSQTMPVYSKMPWTQLIKIWRHYNKKI